ncbi:MAG: class I SAM-dependent methyltransferase [Candidatus Obscuribacterales bacterium]|nr:class I SAM-dependent methyltransferase [Candidatus Obscuribacterales bacterium]
MSDDKLSGQRFDPQGRFTGLAQIYAKARPTYPEAAVDFIVEKCGLNADSLLVDVGCGTGISSRLFAERKIPTIGIDPNDDMRREAIYENSKQRIEWLSYIGASSEHSGLQDGVADAVIAAQAFHWFKPEPTLEEFVRILKPSGWCILMWNERDDRDDFTRQYSEILHAVPGARSVEVKRGESGNDLLESPLFYGAGKVDFENQQEMDEQGLLGRASSASYVPKAGEDFVKLMEGLKLLFAKNQNNGQVVMKYVTSVYFAQARS